MKARLFLSPVLLLLASATAPDARVVQTRNDARVAAERSRLLDRRAAGERAAAAAAARREAALAQRISATEDDIAAARDRVARADRRLAAGRAQFIERQAPTLRLVAALQSLARRPNALALVRPGATADIVHVRAALGAVAPVIAQRTAALRGEIAGVRRLRDAADRAGTGLRTGRAALQAQRLALVRMEGDHRLRARDLNRGAFFESNRAIALGERARDLVDQMESDSDAVTTGGALAALPGPLPRPVRDDLPAAPPATRFVASPYVLPVAGRLVTGLGEVSATGVRSRGLTLVVAKGAPVVAPAAGRVLFARAFRGYGDVVIIDHGDGWSSALTGLAGVAVRPGDAVAQGAMLGHAARDDEARIIVELRRRGVAVDLTRLIG